jgi:malate/lactate dehydrogenase
VYYYRYKDKCLFSKKEYPELKTIAKERCFADNNSIIYYLGELNPEKSKDSFCLSSPSLMDIKSESLDILKENLYSEKLDYLITKKITERKIKYINTKKDNWKETLEFSLPKKWKINILALGDVGSTLLTGLKLLGGEHIDKIGIYDLSKNNCLRWEKELGQVYFPFEYEKMPDIEVLEYEDLFDCDMFVFCATKGVPSLDTKVEDVRMVQFEENSKIVSEYAALARRKNYKGFFAVVSDPVDLLCKQVFLSSNTNKEGEFDGKGIPGEKIKGYGLGVMNARAAYFAKKDSRTEHYLKEGRAFGPHGKGLIIADSIKNYNEDLSDYLTEKTIKANLEIRNLGYKPYVAPALSSGAISIINTISNKWHYSANFIDGVFMGSNNRNLESGLEFENLDFPDKLYEKIQSTYKMLKEII